MSDRIYSECLYENIDGSTNVNRTELYQFTIDNKESDPDTKITYIGYNTNYKPAHMNFEEDKFDYGDWEDAFFMKVKPCMLRYDGTVDYYLNPNDYSKRADNGQPSDYNNTEYPGNVMIEFPKIYWKVKDNGNDTGTVSISNKKLDSDFVCWSNLDMNGKIIPHFYIAAYDGSFVTDKLRSLSGRTPMNLQTRQTEVTYARANNQTSDVLWYTWVFCDLQIIRLLSLLICKSTNSQDKFGYGNCNSYVSDSNTGIINSGTLDDKGLFYGTDKNKSTGVKLFGIENLWGNLYNAIAGWINVNGIQKVKMTWGQSDNSTVDGYNFDGNGYISLGFGGVQSTNGTYYLTECKFNQYGIIPYGTTTQGSASTYYCDKILCGINQVYDYALVNGSTSNDLYTGILDTDIGSYTSFSRYYIGAALSCKPLAKTE